MKILIIGLSKSGTTALFYLIKNSFKDNIELIFERKALTKKGELLKSNHNVLLKILLFPGGLEKGDYDELVRSVDRKILIIRDPRDNIISELLYYGAYHITWSKPYKQRKEAITYLKEKEANNQNVSVIKLFEILCDRDRENLKNYMTDRYESVIKFDKRYPEVNIIKYEDMLQNSIGDLERYLGFSLTQQAEIGSTHEYVIRKKTDGDWKNWFTEEDIIFFKPILEKYMRSFSYHSDWTLNANSSILPEHSSEYFEGLINKKRKAQRAKHPIERLFKRFFT